MSRDAYDDLGPLVQMHADCEAAARRLDLTAPSLRYDDYPREVVKRDIEITEAAARIANALHLHLD
ncbi:hypothetical protein [Nocardioides dongkuii]|uniref:hypothetical protein n=1 Tax=Nocardioides dongkuii TaxID=2760089 RepID=UPI0015F95EA4|nr:hypothetical protein [Nocardioides dongkuii]